MAKEAATGRNTKTKGKRSSFLNKNRYIEVILSAMTNPSRPEHCAETLTRKSSTPNNTEITALRLDKWLWAARFYKTRKLAADAVSGGKVHLNGQRTKPGKEIKTGSNLFISKDHYTWDITVQALKGQRRPAKEAVLLYEETPESLQQRQKQIIEQRQQRAALDLPREFRPNKKERRQIHRFKRQ